ncbi:PIN domain-containing protein [Streptomyces vinaceus]|uniref:hypothetical protein n=1 Tax=Streptomyces vinaceus TaxID=1960 RepID=UPI00380BEBE3
MFTGTAEELRKREDRAHQIAQQIAALITEAEALGLGPARGEIHLPGASVRRRGEGWTITR